MTTITHKRGDTFAINCTIENQGVAVDVTNWTIACQARADDDTILQTFTVTITDAAAGLFTVSATPAQSELWSIGNYSVDIEFIDGSGEVNSTETFILSVIRDITRG